MDRKTKKKTEIRHLVRFLSKRKRPLTARQLADAIGCGLPTSYARIRLIKAHGCRLRTTAMRVASSGPLAKAYTLVPNAKSRALSA